MKHTHTPSFTGARAGSRLRLKFGTPLACREVVGNFCSARRVPRRRRHAAPGGRTARHPAPQGYRRRGQSPGSERSGIVAQSRRHDATRHAEVPDRFTARQLPVQRSGCGRGADGPLVASFVLTSATLVPTRRRPVRPEEPAQVDLSLGRAGFPKGDQQNPYLDTRAASLTAASASALAHAL